MRRSCFPFLLSAGAGLALALAAHVSWAQGPDEGAVLRLPDEDPRPRATPPGGAPATDASHAASADLILANLKVDPRYAMNRDIEPTPQVGPWMISIQSYVTKEAPEWARQMAGELRSTYKLPAYVFTYGVEERKREYERVKVMLDQQRKALKDKGLELMYATRSHGAAEPPMAILSDDLPLAVAMRTLKVQHIPVQCAVLVGGYPNEDAANRALRSIRELRTPDPSRVHLDEKLLLDVDNKVKVEMKDIYVNPFKRAFVCRNPSIKHDAAASDALDMKLLRKLNADEPYSLLNCKKKITLAVKQFQTFVAVQDREQSSSLIKNLGFNTFAGQGVDQAAHDAHQLAEYLRKSKLDAYVLHTKFTSVVTVGGYESVDDPDCRAMQRTLQARMNSRELAQLRFFSQPQPMLVPR